jgi:hypothetical protein
VTFFRFYGPRSSQPRLVSRTPDNAIEAFYCLFLRPTMMILANSYLCSSCIPDLLDIPSQLSGESTGPVWLMRGASVSRLLRGNGVSSRREKVMVHALGAGARSEQERVREPHRG